MQPTPRGPNSFLPRRLSGGLVCLMAVVLLVLFGRSIFSPSLPQGACAVCSTAQWAKDSSGDAPRYHWMGNGDLAYLEATEAGKLQVCYQKMDARGAIGVVRHGPELSTSLQTGVFAPSPDEQWVAYNQSTEGPDKDQMVLVSADGTQRRAISPPGSHFLSWLSDSRSLLVVPSTVPNLHVYHLDSPHAETISGWQVGDMLSPGIILETDPNFLLGRGAHFPIGNGPKTSPFVLFMRSFRVAQPHTLQQNWQVSPPLLTHGMRASASPNNQHLLWTIRVLDAPTLPHRLLQFTPWRQSDHAGPYKNFYYLSDLNGKGMHPVLNKSGNRPAEITPTWTPDSKHLSFVSNDQLYLVPVD